MNNLKNLSAKYPPPMQLPGGFDIKFLDDQLLFNARYVSQNGYRYIYYEHSPNKVYVDTAACNPNTTNDKFGNDESKGDDGSTVGDTPEEVPFDLSKLDSHFGFNLNEPCRQPKQPVEDQLALLNLNDNKFLLLEATGQEQEAVENFSKPMKAELIDMNGKIIWTKPVFLKEIMALEIMPKGIYILRINSSINKKLIIK